jgi:hypothetical protein
VIERASLAARLFFLWREETAILCLQSFGLARWKPSSLTANTRHRAAQYLKQKNLLRPVLDAVILDAADAFSLTNLLTRSDVPHTLWTRSVAVQ